MGRWTQYDEDSCRLPEGMKRIGYDSDSGCYFFRDRDGSVWRGAEGAEFSEMTKVSSGMAHNEDLEAAPPTRSDGYQPLAQDPQTNYLPEFDVKPSTNPYRTLFPFFLMIAVVLLLIWRLIVFPFLLGPEPGKDTCSAKGMKAYWVQPGDSCWEIARARGCSLDQLKEANKDADCKLLMPGTTMCLPASLDMPTAAVRGSNKRKL